MRMFRLATLTITILLSSNVALASATWNVSASTSDGSPLDAIPLGARVILDISLTTSAPEALGISGSVNDYDGSMVRTNIAASSAASSVLNSLCIPGSGVCLGGLVNSANPIREEFGGEGPGWKTTFLESLSTTPATGTGTGTADLVFPQFQIVMDTVGLGSTRLRIGTYEDYSDYYYANESGGYGEVFNAEVDITVVLVPEPSAVLMVGIGLAGLARRPRIAGSSSAPGSR